MEKYIEHYDRTWVTIMTYQNRYPLQEYAKSVLTTWKMSYEQVRAIKPEAAMLLDQWAFVHRGEIWCKLIKRHGDESEHGEDPEYEAAPINELSFQDSLSVLAQYSLVNNTEETSIFFIHAVVHEWSLYNINDDRARERLCVRAIRMVARSTPEADDQNDMEAPRRLLPHARMAATRHLKMEELISLAPELHQVAYFIEHWESLLEVESLYERALKGKEEGWGPKHTSALDTMNNLATLYHDQGNLKETEEMYLRALKMYEEA